MSVGTDDREMRAALRAVYGSPAPTDIDWWTLRRRILDGAAPVLNGGRRRGRVWWEYAAAWVRPAVPLGVAASIMSAVLFAGAPSASASAASATTIAAGVVADTADGAAWLRVVGEGRTAGASGARDVDGLLSGPQTGDALAVAALGSSAP
jgi:hypothetical protein